MSAVPPTPRVKLRTATRRVPRTRSSEPGASASPDPEPNMRLSRAILVMLLLHVVAVGGILAFSLIKERGQGRAATGPASGAVEAEDSDTPAAKEDGRDPERAGTDPGGTLATNAHPTHPADALTRVSNDPNAANDAAVRIAGSHANAATSSAATNTATNDKKGRSPTDSGKTYVVQKGDSPYSIAEKFKVEPSALLKLNGIDDPKKLRPGQSLHVPAVVRAKTK